MYTQEALKPNTLLHNGAYGIVMRGVQKCTCAGASLRGRNSAPLCCIKLDTATDGVMGTVDGEELQIVFGPGKVTKIGQKFLQSQESLLMNVRKFTMKI